MNARKIKIAEVMRDAIAKTNASVTVETVHAPPAEDVATPL
jgi:hypothetical protein